MKKSATGDLHPLHITWSMYCKRRNALKKSNIPFENLPLLFLDSTAATKANHKTKLAIDFCVTRRAKKKTLRNQRQK